MNPIPQYNRVLLENVGFMRPVLRFEGRLKSLIKDGSALTYQIEELIALGAMEIALETTPMHKAFRDSLSPGIRKRVCLIDPEGIVFQRVLAMMAPIAEEFDLKLDRGAIGYYKSLKKPVSNASKVLYFSLYAFLLGIENQLQIDIDLPAFQFSVHLLRQELRNPKGRGLVSMLEGLLATYEPVSITTTTIRSTAAEQLIKLFEEFVQDETYCYLSEQSNKLGFPQRAKRAITLVGRYAKKLVTKPAFRNVADLSAKGITIATQVPLPDSEMCETLISSGFLPPVVSLENAMHSAHKLWQTQKPEIVLPPGIEDGVREITNNHYLEIDKAQQQNSPDEGKARR